MLSGLNTPNDEIMSIISHQDTLSPSSYCEVISRKRENGDEIQKMNEEPNKNTAAS